MNQGKSSDEGEKIFNAIYRSRVNFVNYLSYNCDLQSFVKKKSFDISQTPLSPSEIN